MNFPGNYLTIGTNTYSPKLQRWLKPAFMQEPTGAQQYWSQHRIHVTSSHHAESGHVRKLFNLHGSKTESVLFTRFLTRAPVPTLNDMCGCPSATANCCITGNGTQHLFRQINITFGHRIISATVSICYMHKLLSAAETKIQCSAIHMRREINRIELFMRKRPTQASSLARTNDAIYTETQHNDNTNATEPLAHAT